MYKKKLDEIDIESWNVEVHCNSIKKCVLDDISDLVGKSTEKQESRGFHRK
jgi:hypothetical protein